MKASKNPINLFRSIHYSLTHPLNMFPYYGFKVYFGSYGSGKTLSAVYESLEICNKYKDVVFITNTAIKRYW